MILSYYYNFILFPPSNLFLFIFYLFTDFKLIFFKRKSLILKTELHKQDRETKLYILSVGYILLSDVNLLLNVEKISYKIMYVYIYI